MQIYGPSNQSKYTNNNDGADESCKMWMQIGPFGIYRKRNAKCAQGCFNTDAVPLAPALHIHTKAGNGTSIMSKNNNLRKTHTPTQIFTLKSMKTNIYSSDPKLHEVFVLLMIESKNNTLSVHLATLVYLSL